MSLLHRKLWRDLVALRWQIASIGMVVASGVSILVAALGTYHALERARDAFYARARFADVFVSLKRAPDRIATELAHIAGVGAVETRLAFDVRLDIAGAAEPVIGRAISLPRASSRARSRLLVVAGRLPSPSARNEVAVNEAFASARRLALGDRVPVILHGRREELTVTGTVLSPEHIAALRPGDFIPDDLHFGVLWLSHDGLASAYQAGGTFNEAVLWLAPGARKRDVIENVDHVLEPHGGLGAVDRAEQPAHRFVDGELSELEVEAIVLPVIFLGVASFLLNTVLARIVAQERTQIATLRALGCRVAPIVRHYLSLAAVIASAGAASGVVAGALMGTGLTRMYGRFFRFPELEYALEPTLVAAAVITSLAAGLLGAFASAGRLVRLAPAQALQAAPPKAFRAAWHKNQRPAGHLPATLRVALRGVASRPLRALGSTFGMGAAMAVLVAGAFWKDSFDALLDHHFRRVQREDAVVTFVEPVRERALREIEHVKGVRFAEGFRAAPVRLVAGPRSKRVELMGLDRASSLRRLVGYDGSTAVLAPGALVISRHLAERLALARGAEVLVEVLEGRRPRRVMRVAAVVDELVGMAAYMDRESLASLLGEAPSLSGALLALERDRQRQIHAALSRLPAIATVSMKQAVLARFVRTMMEIVLAFSTVLTLLGALVVVGIVYNAARILVSERQRELATLRVLGFSRGDISEILLLELAFQVLPALGLGALLGTGLTQAAVRLFGPEDLSIPAVVGLRTWGIVLGVMLGSALAAALLVRRRLDHLDLVSTLKVRE